MKVEKENCAVDVLEIPKSLEEKEQSDLRNYNRSNLQKDIRNILAEFVRVRLCHSHEETNVDASLLR